LATILGSGNQVISWIHIDDMVRVFLFMLDNENLSGTYNAVSPDPVSNKELILEIAKNERGKRFIPVHVPSFALRIRLGEMSSEILKRATVSAEKIIQTGFIFQYPDIESAIRMLSNVR
jgi:NAD dependent epimerase/dehydratase family enzyme